VQDSKEWNSLTADPEISTNSNYKLNSTSWKYTNYWTVRNSLKSMLRSDLQKRQRELKSTISAGKLFHAFTRLCMLANLRSSLAVPLMVSTPLSPGHTYGWYDTESCQSGRRRWPGLNLLRRGGPSMKCPGSWSQQRRRTARQCSRPGMKPLSSVSSGGRRLTITYWLMPSTLVYILQQTKHIFVFQSF